MARMRCGTNAGYHRHRRAGEPTCDACRSAHYDSQADRAAARQRALSRLAEEFPGRWQELFAHELARVGLAPRSGEC